MPSKYKDVMAKLKPMPPQDATRQGQIDAIKASIKQHEGYKPEGSYAAKIYINLRKAADEAEQALKDAELAVEAAEQLLIENHENDDPAWGAYGASPEMMRLVDGASLRLEPGPHMIIKDKTKYHEWCLKQNLLNIMFPPWNTINAMMKKMLLKGEPTPDGTEAFIKTKVVYTPVKQADTAEEEYRKQAGITDELEQN